MSLWMSRCKVCRREFQASYFSEFVCPFCVRRLTAPKFNEVPKENFFGTSPAPFIGKFGYPDVNVGILAPAKLEHEALVYDNPRHWISSQFDISGIVGLRTSMINSRQKANIFSSTKAVEIAREVALSSLPLDIELSFKRKPVFSPSFSNFFAPMGPAADIEKMRLASNSKIPVHVQKVEGDSDLKAVPAVDYLYSKGYDVNSISKILSVGSLGVKRKLVPTRFSITAVDDIVGKKLLEEVRNFEPLDEFRSFSGNYFGNYFMALFFPGKWSFELFETYKEGADFSTDFESFRGRTSYASSCAGGYYAARLSCLEYLSSIKRQSQVLLVRVITPEYLLPLGVWVVREASSRPYKQQPLEFSSENLLLKYATASLTRLGCSNFRQMLEKSRLINQRKQKSILDF